MSRRSVIRAGAAGIAAAALAAGLLAVGAGPGSAAEIAVSGSAAESGSGNAEAGGLGTVVPAPPSARAGDAQTPALGIIVSRTGSRAALKTASVAAEAALPGISVTGTAGLMPGMDVLNFDDEVSGQEALAAAAEIASLPGIAWAEPNYLRYRIATTPVFPTDPQWSKQWSFWDSSGSDGGYSIKAPYAWATTTGSPSVVVAVLDTGITEHPDLQANVVPGYDFVTDPLRGNDNDPLGSSNSRDSNPADPGDWVTSAENSSGPYRGCGTSPSSWHGTHVAGTIAAIADNGIGVTGVAPTVRIQPVRVLGKCGGTVADAVAAITWASGGTVPGVPANATPADVLNMSLGGGGFCQASEQAAIDGALSRGASVVVAAGNAGQALSNFSPASCSGVVRVGATTRGGAQSSFSNYGVSGYPLTVSAPGGDGFPYSDSADIVSTYNSGTTVPGSPMYAPLAGTSMAAPHVAGAAALLYSQGVTSPSEVTARLQAAVRAFPGNCSTTRCGAGILDLSKLFSSEPPPPPPAEIGAPTAVTWGIIDPGEILISFTPPVIPAGTTIDYYTVQGSEDGGSTWQSIGNVPGSWTSFAINEIGLVGTYYYRFAAVLTDGRQGPWSSTVGPVSFEPVIEVPGLIDRSTVTVEYRKRGARYTAIVRWAEPTGPVDGYEARLRRSGSSWSDWEPISSNALSAVRLRPRTTYQLQILAVNEAGYGPVVTIRLRTPR